MSQALPAPKQLNLNKLRDADTCKRAGVRSFARGVGRVQIEYQIFRNGVLIATVSSGQLSFKQHDLQKNKRYVYSIYAVNSNAITLFIGSVSLKT